MTKKAKLFLAIGLFLSVISKVLQFKFDNPLGDFIVIPAAIFFVLTILFSIKRFDDYSEDGYQKRKQILTAIFACSAVVSFQITMIIFAGHHNNFGLFGLIPTILFAVLFSRHFIRILKEAT